MGYTHYWTPKIVSNKKWNEFVTDVKKLHKNLPEKTNSAGGYYSDEPLIICDDFGNNKPILNKEMIWFNGDEKNGLDHETFVIKPNDDEWDFCKTARKPYDLLVCAVLLHAHKELGYDISSDGKLDDWLPAIEFYENVLGKRSLKLPDFLVKKK